MVCQYDEILCSYKRNEVLIHGTTWMDLENVMLSEHSQTRIAIHCLIPFYEISKAGKSMKVERILVIPNYWEGR